MAIANQLGTIRNVGSNSMRNVGAGVVGAIGAGVSNSNRGNGGSSNRGTTSAASSYQAPQVDYYSQYLAALEQARQQRVNAAKASIDAQANASIEKYKNRLSQIGDDYQQLRNQSEVERYKAQKSLREALANRGALDSGAGRQETLTLQNNYGNQINRINTEEQHERNNIQTAINEIIAQANAKKAELEAAAYDSVETILGNLLNSGAFTVKQYSPQTSTNYQTAKTGIKAGTNAFNSNAAQQLAQDSEAQEETTDSINVPDFLDNVDYLRKKTVLDRRLQLGQIGMEEYSRLLSQL